MKTISYQISDEAFELLQRIEKEKQAEYRDTRYPTLEDFKKSEYFLHGINTEEWYLNRNFGGTYHLIGELLAHNLVDTHEMAWHPTFILTEFGKEALKNAK